MEDIWRELYIYGVQGANDNKVPLLQDQTGEEEGDSSEVGCSFSGEGNNVSNGSDDDGDSGVLHDSTKPFTEASFLGVHGIQGANDNKDVLEVTAGEVPIQRHLGEGVEAEDMVARRGEEDTVMDRVGVGDAGSMVE